MSNNKLNSELVEWNLIEINLFKPEQVEIMQWKYDSEKYLIEEISEIIEQFTYWNCL